VCPNRFESLRGLRREIFSRAGGRWAVHILVTHLSPPQGASRAQTSSRSLSPLIIKYPKVAQIEEVGLRCRHSVLKIRAIWEYSSCALSSNTTQNNIKLVMEAGIWWCHYFFIFQRAKTDVAIPVVGRSVCALCGRHSGGNLLGGQEFWPLQCIAPCILA
jgi:hypothetical protein